MEKIKNANDDEDTMKALLTEVWEKSNEIHKIEEKHEEIISSMKNIRTIHCLSDVAQGAVLTLLLLRPDERVRSLFSIFTLSLSSASKMMGGTGKREGGIGDEM